MHGFNKRDFLKRALFGGGAIGLRSMVTGLPPAFLLYGRTATAQATRPTYLIMSSASAGHPMNGNAPGTYPNNPNNTNDPIRLIDHPLASDLGNDVIAPANGQNFRASDFENPIDLRLGNQTFKAAGPWGSLPRPLLDRSTFFHLATMANAHPEFAQVMQFHGAIKGPTGTGQEMFASFVAQENAAALGTLMNQPISLGGSSISFEGRPLGRLQPTELKSLFTGGINPVGVADPSDIVRLRDVMLDDIYRSVRQTGSHAQKEFVDQYALGRVQAAQLGDDLQAFLADIDVGEPADPNDPRNGSKDEIRAAVGLIKLKVTPVVVMETRFGGDNHQDSILQNETRQTIESVDALGFLWQELNRQGLQDDVTFANLDVFGRTLRRNQQRGGRDHNRNHHVTIMFGPKVTSGVVGGVEPTYRNNSIRDFAATAIGDIPFDETLMAAGKTLAAACGVPQERIDRRIVGGQVVNSVISG